MQGSVEISGDRIAVTISLDDVAKNARNLFHQQFSGNRGDLLTLDPETGSSELEGIPPLLPGCTSDQGASSIPHYNCSQKGTFLVTLNDNGNESPTATGSWGTVGLPDGEVFITREVNGTTVPEPSTLVLLSLSLIGLFVLARPGARQKG